MVERFLASLKLEINDGQAVKTRHAAPYPLGSKFPDRRMRIVHLA